MGKPITNAQVYLLLWAEENNGFSEIHNPPHALRAPDGRWIRLIRTACDRNGLLGLGRRGMLCERGHGIWQITNLGRAELRRPAILKRIASMADETASADRKIRESDPSG